MAGWRSPPSLAPPLQQLPHLGSARRISDAWEQGQGGGDSAGQAPVEAEQLEDSLDVNELQLSILITSQIIPPNLFLQGQQAWFP